MNKKQHINFWRESAQHDLESAKSMFDSARYDWCLFVGHSVLEKILKAIFVDRNDNKMPPKIHNLVRLAELGNVVLDDKQRFYLIHHFVNTMTDFFRQDEQDKQDKIEQFISGRSKIIIIT